MEYCYSAQPLPVLQTCQTAKYQQHRPRQDNLIGKISTQPHTLKLIYIHIKCILNEQFGLENVYIINVWGCVEIISLIPLNNQVQGQYCKLRTEIFLVHLWPRHKVHAWAINQWEKKEDA